MSAAAWLIAGVVLAVGEMVIMGFFLGPFALGAFAAAIAGAVGSDTPAYVTFAVVTALSFGLLRPIARRHLRQPARIRTGAAALVGRPATVTERIDNAQGVGAVKLEGEVWSARSYLDDDGVVEVGRQVQVVEIRGAIALVSEV